MLGLPGVLVEDRQRAVELAARFGVAVGATVRPRSRFARKHYFYPDLPKGYQISQYDEPICEGGAIDIGARAVELTRIHLEEDAGKSSHAGRWSRIDLNRRWALPRDQGQYSATAFPFSDAAQADPVTGTREGWPCRSTSPPAGKRWMKPCARWTKMAHSIKLSTGGCSHAY